MEQIKIPGFDKKTYRFILYYNYQYIGYKEVKAYNPKQAWAILYKVCPEVKTKGYKVTDLYIVD
jgi:hypothetical protein